MKWCLDLCSGLGGFSQAFVNDPAWGVIRIENNPILSGVEHTRLLDVRHWMDWLPGLIAENGKPDIILASPPCLDFSMAYNAPGPKAKREGFDFEPNMEIVEAISEIIDYVKPSYFIVENVKGAIPHFLVYLNRWKQRIGPFYLWGNFPYIQMEENYHHRKSDGEAWSSDPLRANKRALIPLDISEAILDAISAQTTLFQEWA